ncbi:MAG: DUF6522 family protein [Loktanella sp.]|nr:DUF6522 family protein [Loktanella sp.]
MVIDDAVNDRGDPQMSHVSISTDGFVVDAEIVGAAFDIPAAEVPAKLRNPVPALSCWQTIFWPIRISSPSLQGQSAGGTRRCRH